MISDRLKEIARLQTDTTYQELGSLVGLNMSDVGDRVRIAQLLDSINKEEVTQHGRRMLSVLVIRDDTNMPGQGFFTCAKGLGLYAGSGAEDELAFFCKETRQVHDLWRSR